MHTSLSCVTECLPATIVVNHIAALCYALGNKVRFSNQRLILREGENLARLSNITKAPFVAIVGFYWDLRISSAKRVCNTLT